MITLEQFHFIRPAWLLMLIPLAGLLFYRLRHMAKQRRGWGAICDPHLLPYVLHGGEGSKRYRESLMIALGGALAVVALAGPAWNQLPQPVYKNQTALVIALDLSRSMDATDVQPSRLIRARYKITDILNTRSDGLTALLIYAGDAYVITPLTDDTKTIRAQLRVLTTDIMPTQGNNTTAALAKAIALLKQAGLATGDVLLITDEVDYQYSKAQTVALTRAGYRLSVLGVGTQAGQPIALAEGGYLKDAQGGIVIPGYHEDGPRALAKQGNGIYQALALHDDTDIQALLANIVNRPEEGQATRFQADVWQEQGPWLLLLLIPLAAYSFRRGYLALSFLLLMPFPEHGYAFGWRDLWFRADQQALRALNQGDAKKAAELFSEPAWKAAAQYKASDFSAAVNSLSQAEDVESLYNKGNAYARLGQYADAISAYDQVLQLQPSHEDASYNRQLVEQALQARQEQREQQQEQQGQPGQREQQQEQQGQQGQREQQQEQQGQQEQQEQQQEQREQQQEQQGQQEQREQQQAQGQQANNQQEDSNPEQARTQEQGEQAQAIPEAQQTGDPDHQTQLEQQEQAEASAPPKPEERQMPTENQLTYDEKTQAIEQWLRRIPDDPGGLIRRKLWYQHQQRRQATPEQKQQKSW